MRRYPQFDPPEYVNWKPAPDIVKEYQSTIDGDSQRASLIAGLTQEQLLDFYTGMLRFRLHDITLTRWVKQGVLSKAWLGTGEEAVTIGNVHALNRDTDKVGPMIRNAGACHEMGMPLADMFRAYLATADSPSRGKDVHIGDMARGVIAPVSQVAALTPVAAGVALAFKQRREQHVVLTWIGDGATKTTAFHEGLNLAAVLKLPAIYVLQNNQVALGTPIDRHQAGPFISWSKAYGVAHFLCDGNNVLDTYAATRLAADVARRGGGPVIVFAETFRMGGHATHDETEARHILAPELFEHWGKRDPIGMYECYLENHGVTPTTLAQAEKEIIEEVARAENEALRSRENNMPSPETAIQNVYASPSEAIGGKSQEPTPPKASSTRRTPSK